MEDSELSQSCNASGVSCSSLSFFKQNNIDSTGNKVVSHNTNNAPVTIQHSSLSSLMQTHLAKAKKKYHCDTNTTLSASQHSSLSSLMQNHLDSNAETDNSCNTDKAPSTSQYSSLSTLMQNHLDSKTKKEDSCNIDKVPSTSQYSSLSPLIQNNLDSKIKKENSCNTGNASSASQYSSLSSLMQYHMDSKAEKEDYCNTDKAPSVSQYSSLSSLMQYHMDSKAEKKDDCNADKAPSASQYSSLSSLMQNHLESKGKIVDSCNTNRNGVKNLTGASLIALANQYMPDHLSKSPSKISMFNPTEGNIKNVSNVLEENKNSGLESLVSKLQIQTLLGSEPLEEEDEDDWVIDLSDAIIKTNITPKEKKLHIESPVKFSVPEFIECDVEILPPTVDERPKLPCLFFNPEVQISKTRKRASYKKMSTMGKVICINPITLRVPHIQFKYYDPLNTVKVFKFDSLSPDEVILKNLKEKKGVVSRRTFLEP